MQPQKMTVAFLGPHGTFTEQAARRHFTELGTIFLPCRNISDVFRRVVSGEASFGVVPVENSNEGPVNITLDLLLEHELRVCGEADLRIRHNLIVKPGTKTEEIQRVLSHPQALAQCRKFLQSKLPWAERVDASSTARAVEMLSETEGAAAIGTELAAERNGMEMLMRGIEDNPNNFTR
ncbi:MAG: prephenate dehydratase, partial [Candidatus Bathyarchaeia archaeon]